MYLHLFIAKGDDKTLGIYVKKLKTWFTSKKEKIAQGNLSKW